MQNQLLRRSDNLVTASDMTTLNGIDLQIFANRVNARALDSEFFPGIDGLNQRKTWIAPIRECMVEGELPGCKTHAEFNANLIKALQHGLVSLSRCDMPVLLDPEDKYNSRSEINHLNASFHFVRVEVE